MENVRDDVICDVETLGRGREENANLRLFRLRLNDAFVFFSFFFSINRIET